MCRDVMRPTLKTRNGAIRMWAFSIHGWSGWLMTDHGSVDVMRSFIHQ